MLYLSISFSIFLICIAFVCYHRGLAGVVINRLNPRITDLVFRDLSVAFNKTFVRVFQPIYQSDPHVRSFFDGLSDLLSARVPSIFQSVERFFQSNVSATKTRFASALNYLNPGRTSPYLQYLDVWFFIKASLIFTFSFSVYHIILTCFWLIDGIQFFFSLIFYITPFISQLFAYTLFSEPPSTSYSILSKQSKGLHSEPSSSSLPPLRPFISFLNALFILYLSLFASRSLLRRTSLKSWRFLFLYFLSSTFIFLSTTFIELLFIFPIHHAYLTFWQLLFFYYSSLLSILSSNFFSAVRSWLRESSSGSIRWFVSLFWSSQSRLPTDSSSTSSSPFVTTLLASTLDSILSSNNPTFSLSTTPLIAVIPTTLSMATSTDQNDDFYEEEEEIFSPTTTTPFPFSTHTMTDIAIEPSSTTTIPTTTSTTTNTSPTSRSNTPSASQSPLMGQTTRPSQGSPPRDTLQQPKPSHRYINY